MGDLTFLATSRLDDPPPMPFPSYCTLRVCRVPISFFWSEGRISHADSFALSTSIPTKKSLISIVKYSSFEQSTLGSEIDFKNGAPQSGESGCAN
jgi:hypothetical protein